MQSEGFRRMAMFVGLGLLTAAILLMSYGNYLGDAAAVVT